MGLGGRRETSGLLPVSLGHLGCSFCLGRTGWGAVAGSQAVLATPPISGVAGRSLQGWDPRGERQPCLGGSFREDLGPR